LIKRDGGSIGDFKYQRLAIQETLRYPRVCHGCGCLISVITVFPASMVASVFSDSTNFNTY
jgi:hypothetical protein